MGIEKQQISPREYRYCQRVRAATMCIIILRNELSKIYYGIKPSPYRRNVGA